jgi:hypothetical protein
MNNFLGNNTYLLSIFGMTNIMKEKMGKYNDYKKYSPKTTQEIMTGTGN